MGWFSSFNWKWGRKIQANTKKKEFNLLKGGYEQVNLLEPEETLNICEKCSSENLKEAKYCHYCGYEL